MKRIVVPTDLSPLSLNGLKLAILLAKNLNSKIDMVYVKNKDNQTDNSEIRKSLHKIIDEYKTKTNINKGETVLIPAELKNLGIKPDRKSKVLEVFIG